MKTPMDCRTIFFSLAYCLSSFYFSNASASTIALSGQFKVSESGAATYKLPIDIPKGRGGVKPNVSLSYSSSSGDGYLGFGWGLQANSVISRCPSSFEQDGKQRGVKLDNLDKFCLDGQRLILVSGTYGAANSKYRKELDDFSVTTALGQLNGGGPAAFKVENKAGETHYYGDVYAQTGKNFKNGEGSNQFGDALVTINNTFTSNNDVARLWAIKGVEDAVGNYISFHYTKTQTEHYISRIDYAGHSAGALPYQSIQFDYIDNPKPKSGYLNGGEFSLTKLLNHVDVVIDGVLSRRYNLTYNTSDVIEERNYLDSIIACVDEQRSDCSQPIVLSWTRPANKPEVGLIEIIDPETQESRWVKNASAYYVPFNSATKMSVPAGEYRTAQVFDADGDGLADMIYARGGRWYKRSLSTGVELAMTSLGANKHQYAQSIDIDGDGQRDLLVASSKTSQWHVIAFKPSTIPSQDCEPDGNGGQLCVDSIRDVNYTLTNLGVTATGLENSAMVADVNGDGLEDIVFLGGDKIKWYKNLRGSFANAATLYTFPTDEGNPQFEPLITQRTANFKTSAAIDVNGDGLTDLLLKVKETKTQCVNSRGQVLAFVRTRDECERDHRANWQEDITNDWRLLVSTGSSYVEQQRLHGTTNVDTLRVADINGDGLTDIFYETGNRWWQRLSNGMQFTGSVDTGVITSSSKKYNTYFVDLNGDGRTDMLAPSGSSAFKIYMSVPTTGHTSAYWQSRGTMSVSPSRTIRFGDVWGRGRVDMLSNNGSNWYRHANALNKNDSTINAITDGFGVKTQITYAQLTDSVSGIYDVYKTQNSSNIDPSKNFSFIAPLKVVKRVSTEVSNTSEVAVRYEYGGLLVNRLGRGFQGFELLRTIDEQSGIETETLYEQTFPQTGLPKVTRQTYQGQALSESRNRYTFSTTSTSETAKLYRQTDAIVTEIVRQYDSAGTVSDLTETQTVNSYDTWGNLEASDITITDLSTNQVVARTATTNQYNGNGGGAAKGRLSKTTVTKSRFGQRLTTPAQTRESLFTYYNNGLLHTSVVSPNDIKYKLTSTNRYDTYGNKLSTSTTGGTTASGGGIQTRTSSKAYDSRGRFVKSSTNTLGDTSTNTYNGGSADSVTGPILSATLTDANTRSISKHYDLWGRLTQEVNPDGSNARYSYALCSQSSDCGEFSDGYLISTKTQDGAPVTKKVTDRFGREVGTLTQGFTGQWIVTATTYDAQGRVDKQYEPNYDSIGSYFTQAHYDSFNRISSHTLPSKAITYRYYSGFETLKVDVYGKQKSSLVNALGEQVQVTDELYSELNFVYDAYGNLLNSYVKASNGDEVLRTQLTYDKYGRKTQSIDLDKGTWSYTYNAFGELLTQTNASNQVTTFYYDSSGRKVRRTDAEGTACWLYGSGSTNNAGMLTFERSYSTVTSNCNASGYQQQKAFIYDNDGKLKSSTTTVAGNSYGIGFDYDGYGRLSKTTYPNSLVKVNNHYNSYGYLSKRTDNSSGLAYQTINHMNARNQVTDETYGNGAREKSTFTSAMGWKDSVTLTKGRTLHKLEYDFDLAGNLEWRKHQLTSAPATFAETYVYDDLYRLFDRVITVSSGGSTLPVDFKSSQHTRYDDWGNITSKTGTGSYRYDINNPYRLSYICEGDSCSAHTEPATAQCPAGYSENRSTGYCERRSYSGQASQTYQYTCPANYYLVGTMCIFDFGAGGGSGAARAYGTIGGGGPSDCIGGSCPIPATLTVVHSCPSGETVLGSSCYSLETRPAEYQCPEDYTLSGQTCSASAQRRFEMDYDERGNITSDGLRELSYTSSDLVKTITKGNESSQFKYDVNRKRFERYDVKKENNVNAYYTTYYVDGLYEKVVRTGGGQASLIEEKLYVGNVVITKRSNNSSDIYYLHKDHQGSTTTVTNSAGSIVQQFTYDPWGKQIAAYTSSLLNGLISPSASKGYTGHESVEHMDIIHMNGRIYDAEIGRFLQADPFIQQADNLQNYNRYAYVLNNPMSYT
ncbi:toxin TcdB middle/N-terminal domain-containing protein, partial [Shewanella fidelis]|uniref:toxin TcdB middle/N-terminal domain-containing protein n=1 Tax=Shewanella fidelis TaxID=173509 RepID=UPI00056D3771